MERLTLGRTVSTTSCGAVMRQLLGVGSDGGAARVAGYRYSSPRDADVPLKR